MEKPKSRTRVIKVDTQDKTRVPLHITIDEEVIPHMVLKREGIKSVNSLSSLVYLKDSFLAQKKADGAAEETLKGYERGINKLFECLTFNCIEDVEEYKKVLDTQFTNPPKPNKPTVWYGGFLPIETLDSLGDLDSLFIDYLKDVDEIDNLNTILHYKRTYRVFMYYAMDKGFVQPRKIEVKEAQPTKHDVYTDAELKKLLKAPQDESFNSVRDWVLVNYLMGTGNRVSTVVALNINDIDFDDNKIWICKQKNGKQTLISLVKQLRPILKEYIINYRSLDRNGERVKGNEPLFPNWYGGRLSADGLKKAIARYNNSRGVDKTSIHLFRHTFAKKWVMDGGDLLSLQQMLGQSSLKVVQHYANLWGRDIQEKADKHALLQHYPRTSGKTIKKNPYRE